MTNRESFLNELELAGITEQGFYAVAMSVLIGKLKGWRDIAYKDGDNEAIDHYDALIAAATIRFNELKENEYEG